MGGDGCGAQHGEEERLPGPGGGEEEDRKRGRGRDRGSYGPTSSFTEKKDYKPTVNLEYIDDNGRAMNSKEAFRFLSHKFHGKGSGKLKTEKRFRKVEEDKMMEKM